MFITEAKTSKPFKQYRKQQVKSDIIVEYANGVKQKFQRENNYGAIDKIRTYTTNKQRFHLGRDRNR